MKIFIQIITIIILGVFVTVSTQAQQTTYLLPDGSVLPTEKLDSLSKAWGDGNIMLRHSKEDDEKNIIRLVRVTADMKQKSQQLENNKKQALADMLNKPAPDFQLTDLQGRNWSLQELRGKIVVLNFWFTSCVPCIREMPELNKLAQSYENKNVVFLGLTNSSVEQVNAFLRKQTFNYTLLPNASEIDKNYQVTSWPTSIVIDQQGAIKKRLGSSEHIREELASAIDALQ